MPHALQTFSGAYKRIDPVFSKRSRQLLRSLERCKVAAQKAAAAGEPGTDMFTNLREFLKDHKAFAEAYASRSQHLQFPEAEQMLFDLSQLKVLDKHGRESLSGENREAMFMFVQTLLQ